MFSVGLKSFGYVNKKINKETEVILISHRRRKTERNEAILAIHVLEAKAACVLFVTRFDSGSPALLLDRLVQTELCLNRQGVKDYFVTVKVKFNAKNIPESTGQSKPKPWERRRTEYMNDTR